MDVLPFLINRTFLGENHSKESKYRESYKDPGNGLDIEVGQSQHSNEHENPSNILEKILKQYDMIIKIQKVYRYSHLNHL